MEVISKIFFDKSPLLQYLDSKMSAVHGNSKKRRSLGNIYAIYSILLKYTEDFYNKPDTYRTFEGYDFSTLKRIYTGLYGGSKLQNHSLNSRANTEFKNKFPNLVNDLIVYEGSRYLLHIDYLYTEGVDISKTACHIVEKYIELLQKKDRELDTILDRISKEKNTAKKKEELISVLTEDAEARIFEIVSYAILKNHYKKIDVYFGYTIADVEAHALELYKTGRTNANDGGIDFVMRPVGRFFQVTEVGNYDKYLLDMDKTLHFPIT